MLAKSLMHGLLQAGMANCGKHFPGHGFVKADSHIEIPVDRRSLKAILADDAAPYDWLNTTLTSVMPAHVIYPKVDARPAGFSPRGCRTSCASQLGFDGAIFSDDLSMAGARRIDGREVSYTEAARGGAERRLRHGAAVQPVGDSEGGPRRRAAGRPGRGAAQGRSGSARRQPSEQRRLALLPVRRGAVPGTR